MSHSTTFYKVTCDQDNTYTRICHTNEQAQSLKSFRDETEDQSRTYTVTTITLGDTDDLLANLYCQIADITYPEGDMA